MKEQSELAELQAIKRLLIFFLLKEGVRQEEVASALGVSQSAISKMFPAGIKLRKKK